MTDRTRQGLGLLAAALTLGIAADVLSHTVPARLDAALGLAMFVLVLVALSHSGFVRLPAKLAPLGAPLALLGIALIWRDSPVLFGLNLLGIATVAALASPRLRAVGRRRAGLGDYALGAAELVGGAAAGAPAVAIGDVDWGAVTEGRRMRQAGGAAVGLAAAVPVAAVFGSLLMRADPVFDRLVVRSLHLDPGALASHAGQVFLWGWLAAGVLRVICRSDGIVVVQGRRGALGPVEVGIVLAVVDLLFLAFVAVQFRYLFGGDEQVQAIAGMSYAEYARRGFFELVTVAALSLPLLLLADWSLDQRDPARGGAFRWLALLMLVLLDVMFFIAPDRGAGLHRVHQLDQLGGQALQHGPRRLGLPERVAGTSSRSLLMLLFMTINLAGGEFLSESNIYVVMWKFAVPVLAILVVATLQFDGGNFTAGGGFMPHGMHGVFAALTGGVVFATARLRAGRPARRRGSQPPPRHLARHPHRDAPRIRAVLRPPDRAHRRGRAVARAAQLGQPARRALLQRRRVVHPGRSRSAPAGWRRSSCGRGHLPCGHRHRLPRHHRTPVLRPGRGGRNARSPGRTSPKGVPVISILLATVIGLIAFGPFPSWSALVSAVTGATAVMYAMAPGRSRRAQAQRQIDDAPTPHQVPYSRRPAGGLRLGEPDPLLRRLRHACGR